jgi:hypothetical protein
MKGYTLGLFAAIVVLLGLFIVVLHFFPKFLVVGLLCAGAAGSCVSVVTKLPILSVSLSGELEAYGRRILSRICSGLIASVIGSALLGWGILSISINNQSYADALNECSRGSASSCTSLNTLILLGVPLLFGFSERALTSFEKTVFGSSDGERGRRR